MSLIDHRHYVIVGVQINTAVQSHRRSLLCVTTQVTREGNPSRAQGPVRGLSSEDHPLPTSRPAGKTGRSIERQGWQSGNSSRRAGDTVTANLSRNRSLL